MKKRNFKCLAALTPLLLLAGCGSAPLANFLDWVAPGKVRPSNPPLTAPGRLGDPIPVQPATPSSETPIPTQPKPATRPLPPLEPVPNSAATTPSATLQAPVTVASEPR